MRKPASLTTRWSLSLFAGVLVLASEIPTSWTAEPTPVSPQLVLCHIAERVLGLPKSY